MKFYLGGLGILAGHIHSLACIPLSIRLHGGLQALCNWDSSCISNASHVVQMAEDAYQAAKVFGVPLLLLDWYFLSVPALTGLRELTLEGSVHISEQIRYQRTPSKGKVSEGAMMRYLRKYIFHFMGQSPELRITQLMQEMSVINKDLLAS